jgi:hypothetical protein
MALILSGIYERGDKKVAGRRALLKIPTIPNEHSMKENRESSFATLPFFYVQDI